MKIQKFIPKPTYSVEFTEDEFIALCEYLGVVSRSEVVSVLTRNDFDGVKEKSDLIYQVWSDMYDYRSENL